jgi:hypothetical protein
MQTKGSKYTIFGTHQILPNLHFASPFAKQNQSMKHKSSFVGETIAFSGRVKSRKDLLEMIPTNILKYHVVNQAKITTQKHGSYIMSICNEC